MLAEESWYVVAVEPRAEAQVAKRAGVVEIPVYYPTGKQIVRNRRRVVEFGAERPAMPGYVFVKGGGHFARFRRDFDTPDAVAHCLGWLSGPDGPEPVHPDVVDDLKQRAAAGAFNQTERDGRYWAPRWLKSRVKVRIIAGPFKGRAGEVWRLTAKRRVSIWVQMLGSVTLTECPVEWIARAR